MDGYGTSYLAGSNWYNRRLELDEDAIFTKGPIPVLGSGSYAPSINQSKRNTSNVQNLTHLGHEHQAPDHEATQPMMGY
jgi:hypothetical protein